MADQPQKLLDEVSANYYTIGRKLSLLIGFSSAKNKIAKQRTRDWLGQAHGLI